MIQYRIVNEDLNRS